MIEKYLKKMRDELIEKEINADIETKKLEEKREETVRLLKKLREEEQKEFSAFSPRRNEKLYHDIKIAEESQTVLREQYESLVAEKQKIRFQLMEINQMTEDVKKEYERETLNRSSIFQYFDQILQKIHFASDLVYMDPMRCKIELSNLSQMIQHFKSEIET